MLLSAHTIQTITSRLLGALALTYCALGNSLADTTVPTNDYPTQARVEYVFACMNKYGGENYDHMYGCVCAIDKIAEKIPYANFVATSTLAVMSKTSGERAAAFRDAGGGRDAIKAFETFLADTETNCGLKKKKKAAS